VAGPGTAVLALAQRLRFRWGSDLEAWGPAHRAGPYQPAMEGRAGL